MTPEELAARHPRLYYVTRLEAVDSIRRHGILPASDLLSLFEVPADRRRAIESERRASSVTLTHPVHGRATITDNSPLRTAALASCLDDGLLPEQWLRLLNARVFFWADPTSADRLLNARLSRPHDRALLVFDTLGIARAHADQLELSPINSGATLRRPARRGLSTFTPLARHSLREWRNLRGGQDTIREITSHGAVDDAERHLVEVCRIACSANAGGDPPRSISL